MEYFDTHAHLFLEEFNKDLDEIIDRALKNGINNIVLPNVDLTTINEMNKVCEAYPNLCHPTIGIHPSSIKKSYKDDLKKTEELFKTGKYIAIGEIGIDLYWDKTYKKEQIEAFHYQINLALKNNLPIIIHNRKSFNEIIEVLNNYKNSNLKGIFHCFSGSIQQAEKIIEKGFLMGIGGVVTFKNSKLGETIKDISLEYIVLETDAPYLAPDPKRGRRNESSYLFYIAKKIAEIKTINIEEVARKTTSNARQLFNI